MDLSLDTVMQSGDKMFEIRDNTNETSLGRSTPVVIYFQIGKSF